MAPFLFLFVRGFHGIFSWGCFLSGSFPCLTPGEVALSRRLPTATASRASRAPFFFFLFSCFPRTCSECLFSILSSKQEGRRKGRIGAPRLRHLHRRSAARQSGASSLSRPPSRKANVAATSQFADAHSSLLVASFQSAPFSVYSFTPLFFSLPFLNLQAAPPSPLSSFPLSLPLPLPSPSLLLSILFSCPQWQPSCHLRHLVLCSGSPFCTVVFPTTCSHPCIFSRISLRPFASCLFRDRPRAFLTSSPPPLLSATLLPTSHCPCRSPHTRVATSLLLSFSPAPCRRCTRPPNDPENTRRRGHRNGRAEKKKKRAEGPGER